MCWSCDQRLHSYLFSCHSRSYLERQWARRESNPQMCKHYWVTARAVSIAAYAPSVRADGGDRTLLSFLGKEEWHQAISPANRSPRWELNPENQPYECRFSPGSKGNINFAGHQGIEPCYEGFGVPLTPSDCDPTTVAKTTRGPVVSR